MPVFVDIREDTLNIDERLIEAAITPRTRAILPVHYAGVSCDMDAIVAIARRHRFHEEMSAIPQGVQVHVMPTGGQRLTPGLRQFRYRDRNQVSNSIDRSYAAAASYLAAVAAS